MRPTVLFDRDVEAIREFAHLPFEVGAQILVAEEDDVELSSAFRNVSMWRSVRRSVDPISVGGVSSSTHDQNHACGSSGRGGGGVTGASSMPSMAAARALISKNAGMSRLSMWLSIDNATSRGSRPTTT